VVDPASIEAPPVSEAATPEKIRRRPA